jgi:hypothetical protein
MQLHPYENILPRRQIREKQKNYRQTTSLPQRRAAVSLLETSRALRDTANDIALLLETSRALRDTANDTALLLFCKMGHTFVFRVWFLNAETLQQVSAAQQNATHSECTGSQPRQVLTNPQHSTGTADTPHNSKQTHCTASNNLQRN